MPSFSRRTTSRKNTTKKTSDVLGLEKKKKTSSTEEEEYRGIRMTKVATPGKVQDKRTKVMSVALQKADDMAATFMKENETKGCKATNEQVLSVLSLIAPHWPTQSRPNVASKPVTGMVRFVSEHSLVVYDVSSNATHKTDDAVSPDSFVRPSSSFRFLSLSRAYRSVWVWSTDSVVWDRKYPKLRKIFRE